MKTVVALIALALAATFAHGVKLPRQPRFRSHSSKAVRTRARQAELSIKGLSKVPGYLSPLQAMTEEPATEKTEDSTDASTAAADEAAPADVAADESDGEATKPADDAASAMTEEPGTEKTEDSTDASTAAADEAAPADAAADESNGEATRPADDAASADAAADESNGEATRPADDAASADAGPAEDEDTSPAEDKESADASFFGDEDTADTEEFGQVLKEKVAEAVAAGVFAGKDAVKVGTSDAAPAEAAAGVAETAGPVAGAEVEDFSVLEKAVEEAEVSADAGKTAMEEAGGADEDSDEGGNDALAKTADVEVADAEAADAEAAIAVAAEEAAVAADEAVDAFKDVGAPANLSDRLSQSLDGIDTDSGEAAPEQEDTSEGEAAQAEVPSSAPVNAAADDAASADAAADESDGEATGPADDAASADAGPSEDEEHTDPAEDEYEESADMNHILSIATNAMATLEKSGEASAGAAKILALAQASDDAASEASVEATDESTPRFQKVLPVVISTSMANDDFFGGAVMSTSMAVVPEDEEL